LSFTPVVLAKGIINLRIAPEVSELDFSNAVTISGTTIPSLVTRNALTTVELRDGQSFAIAGLLQNDLSTDQKQLPWLADVPVLGALARSASYQKKETDLVIIITPRLVRPARPGEHLRTPLDDSKPANDPDFFLLGQSEITEPMKNRLKGRIDGRPASIGHILDVRKGENHASN
jgi:pilus assembly protein CpaC